MMKFECRDLGLDCSFVATGNTLEEVKQKGMEHVRQVHGDLLAAMPQEQLAGLDRMLESKIKTA